MMNIALLSLPEAEKAVIPVWIGCGLIKVINDLRLYTFLHISCVS